MPHPARSVARRRWSWAPGRRGERGARIRRMPRAGSRRRAQGCAWKGLAAEAAWRDGWASRCFPGARCDRKRKGAASGDAASSGDPHARRLQKDPPAGFRRCRGRWSMTARARRPALGRDHGVATPGEPRNDRDSDLVDRGRGDGPRLRELHAAVAHAAWIVSVIAPGLGVDVPIRSRAVLGPRRATAAARLGRAGRRGTPRVGRNGDSHDRGPFAAAEEKPDREDMPQHPPDGRAVGAACPVARSHAMQHRTCAGRSQADGGRLERKPLSSSSC